MSRKPPLSSAHRRPCDRSSCQASAGAASSGSRPRTSARASRGLIPADGIYAGTLTVDGTTYPAAISVGNNPTFVGVPERQVEAYVLDEDIDLYGKTVEVAFVERLRGMVKYTTVEALIEQLGRDVADTRRVLQLPSPS
jgi:riboflavin kinase/FMN adenylyltransferase